MSKFFIHRPIFAWVIAIFVVLFGIVSITQLPVAQFPSVAPPTISVTATYPGATSETMTDSVLQLIEREMNGATGLMYMETKAPAGGQGTLTITFQPGTDPNLAQVDVQNRLARATPRLPSVVQALGVRLLDLEGREATQLQVKDGDGLLVIDPEEGCDTGTPAAWAATNARVALEGPQAAAFREALGTKGMSLLG